MLKTRARRYVLAAGALLTLGLSSCGVSTVTQCNNFSEVVKQGEEFQAEFEAEMESFGENFQGANELEGLKTMATGYREAVGRVVTKIDAMGTDLEALELPDEELAAFRDRYTEVTGQFSQELQNTSEAMGLIENVESEDALIPAVTQFQEQAVGAFQNLETLSTQGDELTTEINTYCTEAAG
jgi:hypothetical protein